MFHAYCSKVVRKSVARVLTVISQEQKKALRDVYKNKVGNMVILLPNAALSRFHTTAARLMLPARHRCSNMLYIDKWCGAHLAI